MTYYLVLFLTLFMGPKVGPVIRSRLDYQVKKKKVLLLLYLLLQGILSKKHLNFKGSLNIDERLNINESICTFGHSLQFIKRTFLNLWVTFNLSILYRADLYCRDIRNTRRSWELRNLPHFFKMCFWNAQTCPCPVYIFRNSGLTSPSSPLTRSKS